MTFPACPSVRVAERSRLRRISPLVGIPSQQAEQAADDDKIFIVQPLTAEGFEEPRRSKDRLPRPPPQRPLVDAHRGGGAGQGGLVREGLDGAFLPGRQAGCLRGFLGGCRRGMSGFWRHLRTWGFAGRSPIARPLSEDSFQPPRELSAFPSSWDFGYGLLRAAVWLPSVGRRPRRLKPF